MKNTDTFSTISILKRLFSQHGLPETLVSDNGTQFTSQLFRHFYKSNCIAHVWAPPNHPQSNGQAERFVDPFKCALLKAKREGTTEEILQTFILCYRTTPNSTVNNEMTPAEALMGRKLHTTLDALRPKGQKQGMYQNKDRPLSVGISVFTGLGNQIGHQVPSTRKKDDLSIVCKLEINSGHDTKTNCVLGTPATLRQTTRRTFYWTY